MHLLFRLENIPGCVIAFVVWITLLCGVEISILLPRLPRWSLCGPVVISVNILFVYLINNFYDIIDFTCAFGRGLSVILHLFSLSCYMEQVV